MLVDIMEAILDIDTNGKDGYQFFKDLLDVDLSFDEDCLHLAVSTPKLPTVSKIPKHVPNSYLHFCDFFSRIKTILYFLLCFSFMVEHLWLVRNY